MKSIQYISRKTGKVITEAPPGEGMLKFLYHNPLGELALYLVVKRKIVSELYGRMMNTPGSVSKIPKFVEDLDIDMSEALKPLDQFTSFNDFFYRKLKPEARPIGYGFVSPADAKLLAFENINEVDAFFVKGRKFKLNEYLQNEEVAQKFENAILLIFRLAPNDYHRYHFPYAGYVSESTKIRGSYFSVSPYALHPNFTRVFCENKREYLTLLTEDKGDILISPVGATMVGTIKETFTPNTHVHKGDEMGYFAFGGSTIVVLIEQNRVTIDADLLENTKKGIETAVQMGERIGE